MLWNSEFSGRRILQSGYYVICAFSGLGLLPFLLEHVDRKKSTENVRIVRETRNLNVIEEGKAAREVDRAENEKAAREKKYKLPERDSICGQHRKNGGPGGGYAGGTADSRGAATAGSLWLGTAAI